MTTPTNFQTLPTDPALLIPQAVKIIFSYLAPHDLGICSQVAKLWEKNAKDTELWYNLFPKFPIHVFPKELCIKDCIDMCGVKTREEVLHKLKEFVDEVAITKAGSFTVFFPFHPGAHITLDLGEELSANPSMVTRKVCLWMKKPAEQSPPTFSPLQVKSVKEDAHEVKLVLPSDMEIEEEAEEFSHQVKGLLEETKLGTKQKVDCPLIEKILLAAAVAGIVFNRYVKTLKE